MRSVVVPALLLSVLATGCASSARVKVRGVEAFDRCHGLEYDVRVAVDERASCWHAFVDEYDESAEQIHVDHARARIEALSRGDTLPAMPLSRGVEASDQAPTTDAPATAPASSGGGTVPVARPHHPERLAPVRFRRSPACDPICRPQYDQCVDACPDPTKKDACRAACQYHYGHCMRACD